MGLTKLVFSPAQTECKTAYKLIVTMYGKSEPDPLTCSHRISLTTQKRTPKFKLSFGLSNYRA